MNVELVQVTTADGVRLDGALSRPRNAATTLDCDAWLLVHGTGGNFYSSTMLEDLCSRLTAAGSSVLRINTRGHDALSIASTTGGPRRAGAACEVMDDCRADLDAWIELFCQRGALRIGLLGHSAGAIKVIYSQAHQPQRAVTRIIALSPPRLSHAHFMASSDRQRFELDFAEAGRLLNAGRGEVLMEASFPMPYLISAAAYVEKYGPDERYNVLPLLEQLRVPTLVVLGELETGVPFAGVCEAAAAVEGVESVTIPGADHFYRDRWGLLWGGLTDWLSPSTEGA